MGTTAQIGLQQEDGTIRSIYCNFDGYLSNVGKVLVEHYSNLDKINALLDLGDISCLAPEVGEQRDFDKPTNKNWVIAYGRDRGEDDTEARIFKDISALMSVKCRDDYYYLYTQGDWYLVNKSSYNLELVKDLLAREKD